MRSLVIFLTLLALSVSCSLIAKPINSSKLFSNPQYFDVKMSPSGKYASTAYLGEKIQNISIVNVDNESIDMEIALGIDSKILSYHWLSDKQLYLSAKNGSQSAIFICTLLGDKVDVKLVKLKGYLVDRLPEMEGELLFAKRNRKENFDLYKVKIDDFANADLDNAVEIEHDDDEALFYTYDAVSKNIISSKYDSESKTWTIKSVPINGGDWEVVLEKKTEDYKFFSPTILGDNKLAVLTNQGTDKVALQVFNTKTNEFEDIIYQHPKYDLKSAVYDQNGMLHHVSYEHQGLTRFEYFNPVSKALGKRLAKTFEGLEYSLVDMNFNKDKAIIKVQGANEPGEYLVFDYAQDVLRKLFVSYPELEDEPLYKSKVYITKTKEGVDIESFLTKPSKQNDLSTLLVMPHGGPIGVKDDDRFNSEVQYLVSRGFSVLRVNFRGSEGFGKSFQEQGVGQFGQLIEDDISLVVDEITTSYKFNKMCTIGASYGGYSAVMLAIRYPEKYDCVIAGFGVYDLPLIFNHDNIVTQEKYREPWEKIVGKYRPELYEISPVYFAEKLKAPILLTAGIEDETAVFEHTHRFEYVLNKHNHPVETFYYENTGHSHQFYRGDQHESALKFDFLIRKLGLKLTDLKNSSASAKQAIAEDFVIIADRF
ncbi:MAG: prolyl oligopeptidase family serine peptidase, partial [Kangiellaceae bacterium]|nr:prolyl oligopeptidase family serine peptidase [Kangiellaceae bacterium]